jgi:hypothetical protein
MPRAKKQLLFDFVENPDKPLAERTLANYKNALEKLASKGIKNKNDILNNAKKVVSFIPELCDTKLQKNTMFAALFYATGRQDYEKDPRGLPIFKAFQENYKS